MIKVVSNSQNIPATGITAGVGGAASSITQKIKFKTPLPKPKVKATKFKPLVPLRGGNLLSSNQSYGDSIVLGSSTTTTVTVTSTSPNKSLAAPSQGMSVKVVQVTKSSSSSISSASLLMSGLNKPVVVVSNGSSLKAPQKLTFSGVPSSVTQQLKVMATASTTQPQPASSNTNNSQAKASSALTSKSMPLATGFKMIAVTTVVPGTTQVKTVYIATPIMSLPKTVSQSSNASITTAAPQQLQQQNIRHISSSLASNLQTVVARSINPNNNSISTNNVKTSNNMIQTSAIVSQPMSAASSSIINKNNKLLTNQPKGLGSYKTTLAGTAQSLKLFTATTKSKTPHTATGAIVASASKSSTPLLPSASLLASSSASSSLNSHLVNQQRLIGAQNTFTSTNTSNVRLRPNSNHIVDNKTDTSSFLNIGTVGGLNNPANGSASVASAAVLSTTDIGAITTGDGLRSLDEVSATLSLLNNEGGESNNMLTTEQITATATGETDDMAFLNAGEKFLEKLTAKMTAASPDSMSKTTETFLFPTNLSLDINEQSVAAAAAAASSVFDDYDTLVGSSISIGKGGIAPSLQNGNLRQPALLAKDSIVSSSLISNSSAVAVANNSNFFLAPSHSKVGVGSASAILSSTKLLNNILPSGTKVLPTASNALSIGHYTQNAIVGQSQHSHQNMFQGLKTSSDLNNPSSLQQPSATPIAAAAAILNYTNITNVSGKNTIAETAAADLNKVGSSGFITVGSSLNHQASPATVASSPSIVLEASGGGKSRLNAMKMNSSSSNKLPMSIPGSSKLNISPLLGNSKVHQGAPSSSSSGSSAPSPTIVGGGCIGDTFQQQDQPQQQLILGALDTSSSSSTGSLPKQQQHLHNNLQFYNHHNNLSSSPITNDVSNVNTAGVVSGFLVDEVRLNNNECPPPVATPDFKQGGGVKRKASDVHSTTNAVGTATSLHNSTRSPVSWVRSAAK